MSKRYNSKQTGSILVMVGIALAVLLGMAGLVIDLGHLYVNKTELQSAVDSCALAAAQELDGGSDVITRGTTAGETAGNANKYNFQKVAIQFKDLDINFSSSLAGSYTRDTSLQAGYRYARCTYSSGGIASYLIGLVGGGATNTVKAVAVATLAPGQQVCAIPIGAVPTTNSAPYGFVQGKWYTVYVDGTNPAPGSFGIYNLDGSKDANETVNEMNDPGYCSAKPGDTVKTLGVKASLIDQWNRRFGIYKNKGDYTTMRPDYTGYAYTSLNWHVGGVAANAFKGTPDSGYSGTAENFLAKRGEWANYANNNNNKISTGNAITGLSIGGGYKDPLASQGMGGIHNQWGRNERVVLTPIIDTTKSQILNFACMLMLQPITASNSTTQFEFLGIPGDATLPAPAECTTSGVPGAGGPSVPQLVQ